MYQLEKYYQNRRGEEKMKTGTKFCPSELSDLVEEACNYKSAYDWRLAIAAEGREPGAAFDLLSLKGGAVVSHGFKNLTHFWKCATTVGKEHSDGE